MIETSDDCFQDDWSLTDPVYKYGLSSYISFLF